MPSVTSLYWRKNVLSRFKPLRIAGLAVVAALLATSAYAFTAGVTFSGTNAAGDGSGTVSGYSVSAVVWTLDATDPTKMESVAFTINSSTATVQVSVDGGTSWETCANAAGAVTCDLDPDPAVSGISSLQVVAVN